MDVVIWVVVAVFVVSSTISAVVVTLGLRPVHAARAEVDRRWSDLLATLDARRTERVTGGAGRATGPAGDAEGTLS